MSRIVFRSDDEEDFIILVVEFAERDKIAFEAGFHSTARAEHSGARGIKARIGFEPFLDVGKPENGLPEQIGTGSDLKDRQDHKQRFHVR